MLFFLPNEDTGFLVGPETMKLREDFNFLVRQEQDRLRGADAEVRQDAEQKHRSSATARPDRAQAGQLDPPEREPLRFPGQVPEDDRGI